MSKKLIVSLPFLLLMSNIVFAYDDQLTHPLLTDAAIKKSVLVNYLSEKLGQDFAKDYDTLIYGSKVIDWLKRGSTDEDHPNCRASNHFHNPLQPWQISYMTDFPAPLAMWCKWEGWWGEPGGMHPRYSNITWATGYITQPPYGTKVNFSQDSELAPNTWDKARDKYYLALTHEGKTGREKAFAETFQALGQTMHLLEDMAVPAHVRNDFGDHLTYDINVLTALIGFKLGSDVFGFYEPYERYVKWNPNLIAAASNPVEPTITNARVTDFWDTDRQSENFLGLAEITNANYLSCSTISQNNPTSEHKFSQPDISASNYHICEEPIPGTNLKKRYVGRNSVSGCDHFARVSPFNVSSMMTNTITMTANISSLLMDLDASVFKTYANELLPRAIGYSAGLLDYFFRGELNLVPTNKTNEYILENASEENMAGSFGVYYDQKDGTRHFLATWPSSTGAPTMTIAAGEQSAPFTIYVDPVTAQKPGEFIIAFKGTMGNEMAVTDSQGTITNGAVVGRIHKWWREEWDNGSAGNHTWLQQPDISDSQTIAIQNSVSSGKITMINTLYPGDTVPHNMLFLLPRNSTTLGEAYQDPYDSTHYCICDDWCFFDPETYCNYDYDFGLEFPMPITKNTRLRVKIDEMSINHEIPSVEHCPDPNGSDFQRASQEVSFVFDNGVSLAFTVSGQIPSGSSEYYTLIEPGVEREIKIFDDFKAAGVEFQEPVNIMSIQVFQEYDSLCAAPTETYVQRMVVDHIRIEN